MENQNLNPAEKNNQPSFESLDPKKEKKQNQFKEFGQFVWEMLKIVIIAFAIIIPIRYYVVQPFYVKGASMEPNFYDHEYLIIDEISYRFNQPARGDIVVFEYPRNPQDYFIKRIIGLPGETIEIKNNQIIITNQEYPNGFVLDESLYLDQDTRTQGDKLVELAEDEYYVLGDNRSSSLDSRAFGPIKRQSIIGKTWLRGWPFDRFKVFSSPEYQALNN